MTEQNRNQSAIDQGRNKTKRGIEAASDTVQNAIDVVEDAGKAAVDRISDTIKDVTAKWFIWVSVVIVDQRKQGTGPFLGGLVLIPLQFVRFNMRYYLINITLVFGSKSNPLPMWERN